MNPELINGIELIEWIEAKLPHTRYYLELVEHIHDTIRHQEEYLRLCEQAKRSVMKWYEGSNIDNV